MDRFLFVFVLLVRLLLILSVLQVVGGGQGVLLHGLHTVQFVFIKLGNSELRESNPYQLGSEV